MKRLLLIIAAVCLVLGQLGLANAKSASYEFHCQGQDNSSHIVAETGIINFTSPTTVIGYVELNISNGLIA